MTDTRAAFERDCGKAVAMAACKVAALAAIVAVALCAAAT